MWTENLHCYNTEFNIKFNVLRLLSNMLYLPCGDKAYIFFFNFPIVEIMGLFEYPLSSSFQGKILTATFGFEFKLLF